MNRLHAAHPPMHVGGFSPTRALVFAGEGASEAKKKELAGSYEDFVRGRCPKAFRGRGFCGATGLGPGRCARARTNRTGTAVTQTVRRTRALAEVWRLRRCRSRC